MLIGMECKEVCSSVVYRQHKEWIRCGKYRTTSRGIKQSL